jgi:two-component system cell cycle response regulator
MKHDRDTNTGMSSKTGEKQRLLIVDDSKVIRVTARKILRDHFDTVEAVDGENAWEVLSNDEPFSLIVSDLTMPNLDGFGLLEHIRNSPLPHVREVPVIIITGANDSDVVKERATKAGATDFIGKPFDSVLLLARTQAHASAHTTNQSLRKETLALEEQVTTDTLTTLANESEFMEHGFQQLSYAIRHDTRLSIFRIEIDNYGDLFKQHGDSATEAIIKTVAGILESNTRQEDTAARIGTARFALLLPGISSHGIHNLANRICKDMSARTIKHDGIRIATTLSIGVAAPEIRRNTHIDELITMADRNLACAIAAGGNQVIFEVDRTNHTAPDRDKVDTTLDAALAGTDNRTAAIEATTWVEDIRMIATEMSIEPMDPVDSDLPEIECRSDEALDQLPSMFAGPTPDSNVTPSLNETTLSGTAANDFPAQTEEMTPEGKANFMPDAEDREDEEILITAPFDLYPDFDTEFPPEAAEPATVNQPEEQPPLPDEISDSQETDDVIIPLIVIPPEEEETEAEIEIKPVRVGLLKRIRSLFSRSEKPE